MVEQRTYQIIQLSIYPRHWFSVTCPLELDNCREGNGNPLQYSCLENPMDEGAWWAEVHGVAKSRTWLSHFTLTFHFPALEKKMAAHSSVLAWRIPGMGEPHGLPSMGSHRIGHDWSDLAAAMINFKLSKKNVYTIHKKPFYSQQLFIIQYNIYLRYFRLKWVM